MKNLQRPTIAGGIKYPNPTIYCDLFYISHLFEYFKARKYDLPFNANTYLVEYEIGPVLSKTYKLKQHMEVVEWSARLSRKRAFRVRRLLAPSSMMHVLL